MTTSNAGPSPVRERVQRAFPGPPIEAIGPVRQQRPQVPQVGALLPRRTRRLIRPARVADARPQVGEHLLGHVDLEWRSGYDRSERIPHGRRSYGDGTTIRSDKDVEQQAVVARATVRVLAVSRISTILPPSWAAALETFRPAFRRRGTFMMFWVLTTGMVAQTGATQRSGHAGGCADGVDGLVPRRVPVLLPHGVGRGPVGAASGTVDHRAPAGHPQAAPLTRAQSRLRSGRHQSAAPRILLIAVRVAPRVPGGHRSPCSAGPMPGSDCGCDGLAAVRRRSVGRRSRRSRRG